MQQLLLLLHLRLRRQLLQQRQTGISTLPAMLLSLCQRMVCGPVWRWPWGLRLNLMKPLPFQQSPLPYLLQLMMMKMMKWMAWTIGFSLTRMLHNEFHDDQLLDLIAQAEGLLFDEYLNASAQGACPQPDPKPASASASASSSVSGAAAASSSTMAQPEDISQQVCISSIHSLGTVSTCRRHRESVQCHAREWHAAPLTGIFLPPFFTFEAKPPVFSMCGNIHLACLQVLGEWRLRIKA
mmetsp:Transcript_11603/g.17485  ORF Transcript_11603/g.17485 Transcript_11603/m.17485 type:complete len:239 (-) Transcript_11603:46-762(-)